MLSPSRVYDLNPGSSPVEPAFPVLHPPVGCVVSAPMTTLTRSAQYSPVIGQFCKSNAPRINISFINRPSPVGPLCPVGISPHPSLFGVNTHGPVPPAKEQSVPLPYQIFAESLRHVASSTNIQFPLYGGTQHAPNPPVG